MRTCRRNGVQVEVCQRAYQPELLTPAAAPRGVLGDRVKECFLVLDTPNSVTTIGMER